MNGNRPRVGISSCLLGEPVRYDAGHKLDAPLVEALGAYFDWVAVCPEVEAGFGTPRETMRLVIADVRPKRVALVQNQSGLDVTARLVDYAHKKVEKLADAGLSGFILKKDSPSCGVDGVKLYTPDGAFERAGRGLFAEALIARLPDLPVEEEGTLGDAAARQRFIERVRAYDRLRRRF